MVSPYPFRGGNLSDYETFIGPMGTYNTRYIPTGETIPCVRPFPNADSFVNFSGLDMLSIANLAVGVLNLGVGVYNTFQLHKIQNKLDRNHEQIQAFFGTIKDTLNAHQRTLEVLACSQYNLSQQMDILRQEMHLGFEQVVREVHDVEARRRRKEFYANTHELLQVYERFIDHLPDLSESDRLIDRAERLEALLQAELNQINIGRPERLPLVMALSFSVRAKVDAFEAKGGNYLDCANKSLKRLKDQVCKEAYDFCSGQDLYVLGVEAPEILYQYALLNRSFTKGLALKSNKEPKNWYSPEEIIWEDGLDQLRNIFKKMRINSEENAEKAKSDFLIPLKTIPDYDWYIRFSGESSSTFDVHSCKSVKLADVLTRIGHSNLPEAVIYKSDIDDLRLFALPEAKEKLVYCLTGEFGWETSPKLSR